MNGKDATAILPLILLAATPVAVMIATAVRRSHALALVLTLAGLAASFRSLWAAAAVAPRRVTPLLIVDPYGLYYTGLILAAAFAVALLAYGYLEKHDVHRDEFYVLLLLATLGSAVLASSSHFVSFFLGLEILSISLYSMIAYTRERRLSLEAGIKYLVLAASSAAFLLFGIALFYAEVGSLDFAGIAHILAFGGAHFNLPLLLAATALIVTGIGFKLAVVPFHLWTPDVYEGAPAPVTAFIATVSKGAMFALLLRYFYQTGTRNSAALLLVFSIIAIASMLAGNLLALLQANVKRILAYSSIAHLGYLLVAFEAGGRVGAQAATFYLTAYFITTLGAFGVVTALSTRERDAGDLEDYRGLFWRRPALAGVFTAMLLSLAGIPLTAGFLGKFYILAAGASSAIWALMIVLVVSSAIGLFYYLRIVVAIYSQPAEPLPRPALAAPDRVVLLALTVLLIWFGVYPGPLVSQIGHAIAASL
jgi:NADH-quinone oxidoreductase subunit N